MVDRPLTTPTGSLTSALTSAWIDERVESYAASQCRSMWHDEGHSSHSTCPSCGSKFMRQYEIDLYRKQLESFTARAEKYAEAVGWTRP